MAHIIMTSAKQKIEGLLKKAGVTINGPSDFESLSERNIRSFQLSLYISSKLFKLFCAVKMVQISRLIKVKNICWFKMLSNRKTNG